MVTLFEREYFVWGACIIWEVLPRPQLFGKEGRPGRYMELEVGSDKDYVATRAQT